MNRRKLTEAQINEIRQKQIDYKTNQALLWFSAAARELKTPPDPMKRRQPKILRHQSREQRIASGLTKDPIRAIYSGSNETETTVDASSLVEQNVRMIGTDATFTREVGPNDNYNDRNYRGGKSTRTQNGGGNKTTYRGRRAYGGGTNRVSLEQLLKEYDL